MKHLKKMLSQVQELSGELSGSFFLSRLKALKRSLVDNRFGGGESCSG